DVAPSDRLARYRTGGVITLHLNHRAKNAELGYWVARPYWREGYAMEAARAMVGFAFEARNLPRVWATALSTNAAYSGVRLLACWSSVGSKSRHDRSSGCCHPPIGS